LLIFWDGWSIRELTIKLLFTYLSDLNILSLKLI
jgi:hypothetical protein